MALVVKDRVQEVTTTTGTGTITLGGAALGFQSFATIGNGNTTYYTINDPLTGDWEVGIGTYTSAGPSLSRDTVFSSSNAGALVPFVSGSKNVFVTYPSERAVYLDQPGSYPVQNTFNTLTAGTATLTAGTITTAPVSGTDITNKDYVDSIASGLNYHQPVNYASVAALPSYVYNNGTLGVGATITASVNGALSFGGGTPTSGQRLLVKDEVGGNAPYNGVYTVTNTGSPSAVFVLTRATDYDTSGTGTNEIDAGDYVLVLSGTNASTAWVQQTPLPIVVGTTSIVFLQFNAPITYNAGTGLNLSPATTFNISNTGVTATTYGTASQVPVFAVNAQGQITSVTNTAIAIAAGAVSGLAASATTDTTNAANITSGTLPTGRLSGSYTGITGVGTLAAGTWNGSVIGPVYGGTGFGIYAVGDLLYADTTTSLAKLADVAVGNALISGGVGSAPSWGKIGLATHVSGTLPVANGGTGVTSSTGTGSVVLSTSPTLVTPLLGTPTSGNFSTGTFTWPTFNQNTTGSAGSAANLTGGTISGNYTVNNATSPNTYYLLFGDNTGWTYRFMTSVSGTPTTRFSFTDQGAFNAVGAITQNGSQVLTAGNYNSYAPTLTGTGASGTWSINVTGSAGSASSAVTLFGSTSLYISPTNANTFNSGYGNAADGSDVWLNYRGYNDGFSYFRNFNVGNGKGTAYVYGDGVNQRVGIAKGQAASYTLDVAGIIYSNTSARAPIFYDSDDTTYYLDPNSTTAAILAGSVGLGSTSPVNAAWGSAANTKQMTIYGSQYGVLNIRGDLATAAHYSLGVGGSRYYAAYDNVASVHRMVFFGDYTGFNGVTTPTQNIHLSGTGYATGDWRAPIFYDSNDTGYYIDPASTSNMNVVQLLNNKWYPVNNGSGSSAEIYVRPDNNTTYVWRHIYGGTGTGFGVGVGGYGIFCEHLGGNYSLIFSPSGFVTAPYSYRAPIFYDSNDTTYYVDPHSRSVLFSLNVGSTTTIGTGKLSVFAGGAGGVSWATGFNLGDASNYTTWIQDAGVSRFKNTGTGGMDYYSSGDTQIMSLSNAGILTAPAGSMRAPIFYDSNDTTYYLDPASTSNLNGVLTSSAVSDNNSGLRNVLPGGGSYVSAASTVTGAIQITLPTTNYPMVRFTVKVYTYDGLSFEISCGGHTSGNVWYNTFAYMTTQNRSALNVRFCYSGGTTYVYIGDLGSTWSYPQVFITDVQVGYATYSASQWNAGWVVAFNASTYNNISVTHTVYPPTSSGNNTNPAYASIFYDSNNTAYYVDPASTSQLNTILTGTPSYYSTLAGTGYNSIIRSGETNVGASGNVYIPFIAQTSLSNSGYRQHTVFGSYRGQQWNAAFIGVGGNDNYPTQAYLFDTGGGFTAPGALYSPIFYDSNDTSYYLNPNSDSVVSAIYANNWFRPQGNTGLYFQTYGTGLWPVQATSGSYGNVSTYGAGYNGWNGYNLGGQWTLMNSGNGDNIGVHSNVNSWLWYWDGSSTQWSRGYTQFAGSARAPIFYDSNDTTYYLDPAGSLSLNVAGRLIVNTNMVVGKGNNAVSTNTAVGVSALASVNSNYHTAVGYSALQAMTTYTNPIYAIAGGSTAVGYGALQANVGNSTIGSGNTAIGSGAMYNATGAYLCTTVGAYAGFNLTNAYSTTIVGNMAGWTMVNNSNCVAIGYAALQNYSSSTAPGNSTVAIGAYAGQHSYGSNSVLVGTNVLYNAASNAVTSCTFIGNSVMYNQTNTSTQCTFIGSSSMVSYDGTITNSSALGYLTEVTGDNQVQLGNSSTTTYVYGTVQNRSDARDKADIRDTQLGLDFIEALRPVDFRWDYRESYVDFIESEDEEGKDTSTRVENPQDGSRKRNRYHHGLIAQEVKEVLDAKGIDFGGYQDHSVAGGKDVLTIGYDELVGPLIKAVQELSSQVKALSLELADLKAKS